MVPTDVGGKLGVVVGSATEVVVGSTGVVVGAAEDWEEVLVLGGGTTLKEIVAPHSSRERPSSQQPALVQ